ncbi:MAG: hypothetical protein GX570_10885 [Corynebacterium marinum]|jgi:multicomponent Na+:H+ antiporter subunit C|uniref:Monovalent cation/H+ antiporter subunit C n=1 Tax=Corynebacterium marinum TaxID=349751 RepID=A0A847HDJ6_9CORY|nr:hypothetical protein [Corynebacterium marinum]
MTVSLWYLLVAVALIAAGLARFLLVRDRVARLVAMNVLGSGSLLFLLALAARSDPVDPVLSALVITGLVITVAFTGVAAVLIRRIEGLREEGGAP